MPMAKVAASVRREERGRGNAARCAARRVRDVAEWVQRQGTGARQMNDVMMTTQGCPGVDGAPRPPLYARPGGPPALHVPSSLPPVPAPVSVHVPQPAALFVFVAGLPHRCHRRNYYPFACPLPHPLSCLHLSPLLCLSQAAALPPLERLSLAGPCEWHLGRPRP